MPFAIFASPWLSHYDGASVHFVVTDKDTYCLLCTGTIFKVAALLLEELTCFILYDQYLD